jgi:hypothetical protein
VRWKILKSYTARRDLGITRFSLAILMVGLLWVGGTFTRAPSARAAAGVNKTVNFQGRLLTNSGAVVADGNYNLRFKIYQDGDGVLGGGDETLKWTEEYRNSLSQGVVVKNGYFSVALATYCAFDGSACSGGQSQSNAGVDFNQTILWLSMDVGGTSAGAITYDGEMTPFKRLSSAVYALQAENANKLGGLSSGQYVQLAQGVQTASVTSNPAIGINATSGSNNLVTLQSSGTDVFDVTSTGNLQFGNNANKTINVATAASGNSGNSLTIQAGSGNGTDKNGGDLVLQGGNSTGTGTPGSVIVKPQTNVTTAFNVEDASGGYVLTVDVANKMLGFGLGSTTLPSLSGNGIEMKGALKLSGSGTSTNFTSCTTPGSNTHSARICVQADDQFSSLDSFVQLGLQSTANTGAIGLSVMDARSSTHNPSISVWSPDESQLAGFTWNGSNTQFTLQTQNQATAATTALNLQSGNVTSANANTGAVTLQSGSVAGGTNQISGAITIKSGNTLGTGSDSGDVIIDTGTAPDVVGGITLKTGGSSRLAVAGDGSNITVGTNTDLLLQGSSAYISNPQTQTHGEAFGLSAAVSGADALSVGYNAAANANSVAVGSGASSAGATGGVAVGYNAAVSGFGASVAIGKNASAKDYSVAIGEGATINATSGQDAVAIGESSAATLQGVTIGSQASSGSGGVAVGYSANSGSFNDSIALGNGATTTAVNQMVVGSSTHSISQVLIGNGATNASPVGFTLQGTGGSGSNVAGASVAIAGGRSTGNANGGSLNFQVSAPGSSGSSANSLTTVATISGADGSAVFKNAVNTTAGFQIQNAGGLNLFNVDTSNTQVQVGRGGITIGYTTVGGTANVGGQNGMQAQKFTTTSAGTLNSIAVYFGTTDSSPHNKFQVAIYSDSSGAPGSLIASSGEYTITGSSWNTANITASLSATTSYWMAVNQNATAGSGGDNLNDTYFDSNGSYHYAFVSQTYGTWPGSFGSPFTNTIALSIYATVSTSSAAVTVDRSGHVLVGSTAAPGYLLLQGSGSVISNPQGQTAAEAFGLNAAVSGTGATALGYGATGVGSATAVGHSAGASSGSFGGPVSIGDGANAGAWGVAIGQSAAHTGDDQVSIGNGATSSDRAIAIGKSASAATNGIAIGTSAATNGNDRIVLGYNAQGTADHQLVVGSDSSTYADAYFGRGVTSATPGSFTVHSTGGSGSNIAGGDMDLAGGISTGSGNGGSVNLQVSTPGGSGSSANSLATVASLSGADGSALFKNAVNSTSGFQIQNASGTGLFTLDTTNSKLTLGVNTESSGYFNNGIGGIGQFGNALTYSEQLDNAAWTATDVTVTANDGSSNPAPDGQTSAEKLVSGTTAPHTVKQACSSAACTVTGGTYTFSMWVKTNSSTQAVQLRIDSAGSTPTTGTAASYTATTTWQRMSVTQTFSGTPTSITPTLVLSNNSATVVAWGAQVVAASNPQVYVRTTASAVAASQGVVSNGGAFISSISASDKPLVVQAAVSQSGNLIEAQNSSGTALFSVGSGGAITTASNLTVQGGTATLGTSSSVAGSLVVYDANGQKATITVGDLAADRALTIPVATGSDTFCLVTLANCGGSGANTALSNLASVAINTDLQFANTGNRTVNIAATGAGTAGRSLTIQGGNSGTGAVNGGDLILQAGATGGSGTTGSVTVKANGTNSTTAFQVQNASGANLLAVDSTNNAVSLLGNLSGETAAWQTATNTVTSPRYYPSVVTANGYLYEIGGSNSGAQSTVYYSKLNVDGSPGAWAATTSLSNPTSSSRYRGTAVVAGGYVYMLGGINEFGGTVSTVLYAKLNADGTVGTWQTATNGLPATLSDMAAVAYNGYVYVFGGASSSAVYYARIGADGAPGSWTTSGNSLPATRAEPAAVVANGYAYVMGGNNITNQTTVYYAKLNADGTVGSWTDDSSHPLPAARDYGAAAVGNGYIYFMGGNNAGSPHTEVYYAKPGATGATAGWSTAAQALPAARYGTEGAIANGYLYYVAGYDGSGGTTSVYYASLPRLQVGGNLDLVGLQGQNLADDGNPSDGATGGSITAGNGTFVGSLTVQGQTSLGGSLAVNGSASFTNPASATATGLIKLDNGTNTGSTLSVVTSGNPGSGNALLFGKLTNASVSGNLIDLQSGASGSETSKFTISATGSTTHLTSTNSASAFQIQNSIGSVAVGVDTTSLNSLINNGSVEGTDNSNWAVKAASGGASVARQNDTTAYIGSYAEKVIMSTTSGDGAKYTPASMSAVQYTLSFALKQTAGTAFGANLQVGWNNGSDNACTLAPTLSAQAVPTTGWARYSCTFTATGSPTFLYWKQTDTPGSARTFYIDAVQLEQASSGKPFTETKVQINGVVNSPIVLQNSSDSTTALQIQNAAGTSNLFVADTLNGVVKVGTTAAPSMASVVFYSTYGEFANKLHVGGGTNYVEFDPTSGSQYYFGTARPTKRVTLTPEYPGATMTGDGSTNSGSMTSDFCSDSLGINDNTNPDSICPNTGSATQYNYYKWASSSGTNDYDIWVRYQIPSDFSGFYDLNTIKMTGYRVTSSDSVQLTLYKSDMTTCGTAPTTITSSNGWNAGISLGGDETSCGIAAGDVVYFRAHLTSSGSTNYAAAGDISFDYYAKF